MCSRNVDGPIEKLGLESLLCQLLRVETCHTWNGYLVERIESIEVIPGKYQPWVSPVHKPRRQYRVFPG